MSNRVSSDKFGDLAKRLEHRDTKTAIAAEAELAVLWAVSRVARMTPEPVLPNSSSRPDAASDDLFRSGPAVIEVRAVSDDSFSDREAMDRTANVIANYADQLRKGAGKHLHFEFNERSFWIKRFHRERCVDQEFRLNDEIRQQLCNWITASDWPNPASIRIARGKTDVAISWRQFGHRLFRTFCRMPAVAYDPEDNSVYKALKNKSRQLGGAAEGTLRCVVLVDAGCSLLRRLRPAGGSGLHEVGGDAIIHRALAKLAIDVVIVLSPYRQRNSVMFYQSELLWKVSCFDRRKDIPDGEYERISEMVAQLPRPRFEGYQARDIHRQGGFAPDRNWHLSTTIKTNIGGRMTIKMSANLLHNYLAGRIDAEQFRQRAFHDEKNLFEMEVERGSSIRDVRFESGGMDEDDDYVIFDLDVDLGKAAKEKSSAPSCHCDVRLPPG